MTSGALLSTRPRVWGTSDATPHAASVGLECALEANALDVARVAVVVVVNAAALCIFALLALYIYI